MQLLTSSPAAAITTTTATLTTTVPTTFIAAATDRPANAKTATTTTYKVRHSGMTRARNSVAVTRSLLRHLFTRRRARHQATIARPQTYLARLRSRVSARKSRSKMENAVTSEKADHDLNTGKQEVA